MLISHHTHTHTHTQMKFSRQSEGKWAGIWVSFRETLSQLTCDWRIYWCQFIRSSNNCVLVGFYGISTIVSYLMPNPLYTNILNMYDLVLFCFMACQLLQVIKCQIILIDIHQIYRIWSGWVLCHIYYRSLFNDIYCLYTHTHTHTHTYIYMVWLCIVGYLMPYIIYIYILMVLAGFFVWGDKRTHAFPKWIW